MMKAQELRLGNRVRHCSGQPTEVDRESLSWLYDEPDLFEPMPITEQWLLKFGFGRTVYNDETIYYYKQCGRHTLKFSIIDRESYLILFEHDLCGFHEIADENTCEYVHQLQNLYFALTGEELTINQPA